MACGGPINVSPKKSLDFLTISRSDGNLTLHFQKFGPDNKKIQHHVKYLAVEAYQKKKKLETVCECTCKFDETATQFCSLSSIPHPYQPNEDHNVQYLSNFML